MKTHLLGLALAALFVILPLHLSWAEAQQRLRIAAASSMTFAFKELVPHFEELHPEVRVEVIYGSSGNFHAQIKQGAPFDLFFSADTSFPQSLVDTGHALGPVTVYALGRIALWSHTHDLSAWQLADVATKDQQKIAIANPRHAPYGRAAEEAFRAAGVWKQIETRLTYGENVSQTLQYMELGTATLGVLPLSVVASPTLKEKGSYLLIPADLHSPLEQGYVVTMLGRGSKPAKAFTAFLTQPSSRALLDGYGFTFPQ